MQASGNYYPALSDHDMIFGIVRDRVKSSKPTVISFRSYKCFNGENFKQDLSLVPWHAGEVFEYVDDQLLFWNTLTNEKHCRRART